MFCRLPLFSFRGQEIEVGEGDIVNDVATLSVSLGRALAGKNSEEVNQARISLQHRKLRQVRGLVFRTGVRYGTFARVDVSVREGCCCGKQRGYPCSLHVCVRACVCVCPVLLFQHQFSLHAPFPSQPPWRRT